MTADPITAPTVRLPSTGGAGPRAAVPAGAGTGRSPGAAVTAWPDVARPVAHRRPAPEAGLVASPPPGAVPSATVIAPAAPHGAPRANLSYGSRKAPLPAPEDAWAPTALLDAAGPASGQGSGTSAPMPAPQRAPARSAAAPSGGAALVLQARALRHEGFAPAAAAVLGGLALTTDSERASLGLVQHGRMQVVATSSGGDVQRRQAFVEQLAAAMQEAVDQRAPIVMPLPAGSPPTLCFAHTELHRANGGLTVLTVPIVVADRVVGALLLERRGDFDERALRRTQDAALFVGPVLELKHRVEAPVGGRLIEAVATRGVRIGQRQFSPWRLGAGAAAAAVLVAALWPVTFRVVSPARVEGIEQRILAAPVDGFIASVAVRPGQPVRAGQLIASLEDRDLALQRDRYAAEIAQHDKRYREALAGDDAGEIVKSRALLAQAQAQHALAEGELERTRLRAPFDGVLIDGDLASKIGSPVTRGQPLLTVSTDAGYKVVAEVDDHDVTVLRQGQTAQVLFAGLGQAPVPFTVARIAPVAVSLDQRNVFEVEGRVDEMPVGGLSPGLRGIARIDVDERLQGLVWWERAGHWLRRMLWQLMG